MTGLIYGVDAAFPPPEGSLPIDTRFVAGYIGESGCTPHVWTVSEIAAVRAAGRQFWPIVVPPQRALTPQDGEVAARVAIAWAKVDKYPTTEPILFDVEHSWYVANPSGAQAAVHAFQNTLAASGYQHGIGYLPFIANEGWVAHWTNEKPSTLPAGWVGTQFEGLPGYDLDAFSPSVLINTALPLPTQTPTEGTPDTEDDDMTQEQLMQSLALFFSPTATDGVTHSGEGYGRIEQAVQAKVASLATKSDVAPSAEQAPQA